ncbi:hypothetical protein GQ457_02G014510 [Hibiscus cannabinus]
MIGLARRMNGLYQLDLLSFSGDFGLSSCNAASVVSVQTWHARLGHPSSSRMPFFAKLHSKIPSSVHADCDVCRLAKHKRLPFPISVSVSVSNFDVVHMDIWGPFPIKSLYGHSYFLTIVDDKSRFVWVYPMRFKSDARTLIVDFYNLIETQFSTKIKCFRTDNAKEFDMADFYKMKGIVHQTSCVHTPQQNSIVERKHQHLLMVARALRIQASLPLFFWIDCVLHSVFLINITPTPVLGNKTPYEELFQIKPKFDNLRVFGSLVYASVLPKAATKLHPRAVNIPLASDSACPAEPDLQILEVGSANGSAESVLQTLEGNTEPVLASMSDSFVDFIQQKGDEPVLPPRTRSSRVIKLPQKYADYQVDLPKAKTTPHTVAQVLSYHKVSSKYQSFLANVDLVTEPKNYKQAILHDCWKKAMAEEILALENNQTWDLVSLPPGKKTIGCKWVFKTKLKSDGTLDRYKARLVAKGYTQQSGVDFLNTFSPVAKINTIRTIMAVAAAQNWNLQQLDINNAFFHGFLQEEVYMELPPGFSPDSSGLVCRLKKSLYGLKQASRQWNERLTDALLTQGFKQSVSDSSLFTKGEGSMFIALVVYVDDIILASPSMFQVTAIKTFLHDTFRIKDLGDLKYFLGLEVARSAAGINLCQRKYTLELLAETGFLESKPASTPIVVTRGSQRLSKTGGVLLKDITSYRRLIGKLLYLTNTRPDISFSVQQLSQFLSAPTTTHLVAANRILRYLKGTPGQGLFFPADNQLKLSAFSDSDWASCPDSRKSVTGFCVFLGTALISWKSKKQQTVSRSSSEAEYRALAAVTCELQWFQYLLNDLCISFDCANVYCDNLSAIKLAENPVHHERTKHIEIDCHLIREKIQKGVIKLLPVSTHSQLADCFTKALPSFQFHSYVSKLGMHNLYAPT